MKSRFVLAAISTLLFALFIVQVQQIAAHAELVAAIPEPGEQLDRPPEEVKLTFSEPVGPGSVLLLIRPGFQDVVSIESETFAESPEVVKGALPSLEPGTYTLQWSVFSRDGHPASGSYSFSVLEQQGITEWGLLLIMAAIIIGYVLIYIYRNRKQHNIPGNGA